MNSSPLSSNSSLNSRSSTPQMGLQKKQSEASIMKTVSNFSPIVDRAKLLLMSAALAFSVGSPVQAEDIEIYEGLTDNDANSGTSTTFKPNILFVLDTSGSMNTGEAVSNPRPEFDPNEDYGSSGIGSDIYVYDNSITYTGVSFTQAESNCQAGEDFLNDSENASSPIYFDKLLLWQYKAQETSTSQSCTGGGEVADFYEDSTDYQSYNYIGTASIDSDADYQLTMRARRDGRAGLLGYRADGTAYERVEDGSLREDDLFCFTELEARDRETCTVTDIPSEIVEFDFYYYRSGSDNSRKANKRWVEMTLDQDETCSDIVTVTSPAVGDWASEVATGYDAITVECEADDGVHGSSSSGDLYAQYQESGNTNLQAPNYVSSASNTFAVNWRSEEVEEQYLVSENYHQYLQTSDASLLGASEIIDLDVTESPTDYCQEGGFSDPRNLGDFVRDAAGTIYECVSRIESLKVATRELFSTLDNANVGMMRFNTSEGGSLLSTVESIEGDVSDTVTKREDLIAQLMALPASGSTPLQESFYTAYSYYKGNSLVNHTQAKRVPEDRDTTDFRPSPVETIYTDLTPDTAKSGGSFVSPIASECQDNSIILFSDGLATSDTSHASDISNLGGGTCSSDTSGDCLDELATVLATQKVNESLLRDNFVYTYGIGFGSDLEGSTQLKNATNNGLRAGAAEDSQYYEASSADALSTAFRSIIRSLQQVSNDSFVSPAVAVNAFNRLQFRDDLYFAVFKPNNSPRWNGNIKKYKVNSDGQIVDSRDVPAIGSNGFFSSSAVSFWDDDVDGEDVLRGGAARQLDLNPARKLYANLNSDSTDITLLTETNFLEQIITAGIPTIGEIANNGVDNPLSSFTSTSALDATTNIGKIILWSLGQDVDLENGGLSSDPNYFLGESLHGSPFVIDYGTEDNPDDVLFAGTNQGMIHAIDGDTGHELFAYLADPSLFENLGDYYNNTVGADHAYGVDGEMVFDVVRDGTGSIESAKMYVGQRRGGSKYFALDVTNANSADTSVTPISKLWTIDETDLPRMGQSWSTPVLATVNFCTTANSCGEKDVLFISGGYDTAYDGTAVVSSVTDPDTGETVVNEQPTALADLAGNVSGNAIYMIDRETGDLLWMAGRSASEVNVAGGHGYSTNDEMQHSFVAAPTVIDSDFDGIADFLYAVDIAGRIWRIDFRGDANTTYVNGEPVVEIDDNDILKGNNDNVSGDPEVSMGIIAELSAEADERRFYNPLDVSLTARSGDDLARYNLVVGSGLRAHPLIDEVPENRIYFAFDRNVVFPKFTADQFGNPIAVTYNLKDDDTRTSPSDFDQKVNDTALDVTPADENGANEGVNRYGFYIALDFTSSEKLLNPTLTDDGIVLAVSYSPEVIVLNDTGEVCQNGVGSSTLYQIDLETGEASRLVLSRSGIAAPPVVIEIEDPDNQNADGTNGTKKVLIIGSESFDASQPIVIEDSGGDIDELKTPGLNEGETGLIKRVNWWERRKR